MGSFTKPSQRTKKQLRLNTEQEVWVTKMWEDSGFKKYLKENNKLYYYQIRKAFQTGYYSDAPASRRALTNACKEFKKWQLG